MAFDAFIKIDGVPGESQDANHKDWIEVISYTHGMSQPASATASSVGGASSERVDVHDLSFVKQMDKASPKLYELCCSGKHLATATLELNRAGGDKVRYMQMTMEQVLISSVTPNGATDNEAGFPTETVTLDFGKVKWTYTQQKRADGSGGGNTTGGWDLTENKVYA